MEISILDKKIGENSRVFIIAEAGVCHDGDLEKAKLLVDRAKEAKVDAVKFQTWITEELCLPQTKKAEHWKEQTDPYESQFEMAKALELTYDEFIELKEYCDKKEIMFMSTPDEEKSAKFLAETINVPVIKVGSGELTNIPYLKFLSSLKKPLLVSTGMGTIEEIKAAQKAIYDQGNKDVVFLHCTFDYPTKHEDANLNAMVTMQRELGTLIGYSDHTLNIEVPLVAVALGATIIEKHFTYDRLAYGPDHKTSLSPDQLKEIVEEIRKLEELPKEERVTSVKNKIGSKLFDLITGSFEKKPTEREINNKSIIRKSIVAREDLIPGMVIEEEHMIMKRAGSGGIPANEYMSILGKRITRDIKKNELITSKDLE